LGPPEHWPSILRTVLGTVLKSGFPMALLWGPELIVLYNDAYRSGIGPKGKHPWILGSETREAWSGIWDEIGPLIRLVLNGKESVYRENERFKIERNGSLEDTYWTFGYSPVQCEKGGVAGILVVCTETTASVRSTRKLMESELLYRKLADRSPMWIWITDADVNFRYANRKLLNYIGIKYNKDLTRQVWKDCVHPEDVGKIYESLGKAVNGSEAFTVECRIRNATTGDYQWFNVMGVPFFEKGIMSGFIGSGMSVQKQRDFSGHLEREVALRTAELADRNDDLIRSNRELQSFTFISSHDLQEPLRKIQTFCSVLLDTEYGGLSEKGREKFDRMSSAAERMQLLIDDLLAYSRAGMEKRKFENVELEVALNEVKIDLYEEMEKAGATVELEVSCNVYVVPFLFRQLFFNLLTNSLKYAREKVAAAVKVNAKIVRSGEIDGTVLDGKYVRITVEDNGIGFDNGSAERIFEVLQRLHGQEKYPGTGIGLAIVKRIVENHKGFIRANGSPGIGAIFEIFIPVGTHVDKLKTTDAPTMSIN